MQRDCRYPRWIVVALAVTLGALFTAPGAGAARPSMERVIVLLDAGSNSRAVADELVGAAGGKVLHLYGVAVQGFAAEVPATAVRGLSHHASVRAVTPDQRVSIAVQQLPTGIDRIEGDRNPTVGTNVDADIAIIDTGVDPTHPDLNVVDVVDCTPSLGLFGCTAGNSGTIHWHGTHVAGIAAAKDDGVGVVGAAPGARIHSVRVLDVNGSGYLSQIIAGIDYVTSKANVIDVANMSLGGYFSDPTLDEAIANSVGAGVVYAAAAGNDTRDASAFSPANHPQVVAVSAIADSDGQPGGAGGSPSCRADQDDTFADFSNFGSIVDVAAPGVCILSDNLGGGLTVASGTSMATPHVAGVFARYVAYTGSNPTSASDVEAVKSAVLASAIPQASTCGFTGDPDTSAEPLVFANAVALGGDGSCGGVAPPGDGAPTIAWEQPTNGAKVAGNVNLVVNAHDAEDAAAALAVDFRVQGGTWQPMVYDAPSDRFRASWDSMALSDGNVTLESRVTDSAAHVRSQAISVTVDNVPDPVLTTMTLGRVRSWLDGKRNDQLVATVEVLASGVPVVGAVVSGHFEVNFVNRLASATTASNGVATLSGGRVRWWDFVTYFCVDGVTATGKTLTTPLPYCVLVQP